MDRERASFAARARPLRPSNGPGFSSEKVETPLAADRVTTAFCRSMQSFDVVAAFVSNAETKKQALALASGSTTVWRRFSYQSTMVNLSAANLIGGLVFGSIGFVAFVYGKRMNLWKPMFLGIALMVYPYFVSNDLLMIAIGTIGTAGLFFLR